jgi:hypothetical protein
MMNENVQQPMKHTKSNFHLINLDNSSIDVTQTSVPFLFSPKETFFVPAKLKISSFKVRLLMAIELSKG